MTPALRVLAAGGVALLTLAAAFAGGQPSPPTQGKAPPVLQELIDATPDGGTLVLAPGVYRGPARIDRPMVLDGGGHATVNGGGQGTVLSIAGRAVTVRGLRIVGSGESHDRLDTGLLVEGDEHRVEHNRLDDVLFGIHLRQATRTEVHDNLIRGKDLSLGMRGDGLRLWNSRSNQIRGNRFERLRDLTLSGSPDNLLADNVFTDGRYGLHLVFSPRVRLDGNHLSHTGTGIVVLYSPGVILHGNEVAHALSGGGAGIVFKESNEALVEGNSVLHCAVGMKVDAAPQESGSLVVRGNRFAHNVVGLFLYGDAGGHRFTDNRIEKNLTPIALSAPGVGSANFWHSNYWDDYVGFDRDGNGTGDTPHEVWLFADRIWMETPMSTFFRNSPAFELLDFLERLAPFSAPHRILADDAPRFP